LLPKTVEFQPITAGFTDSCLTNELYRKAFHWDALLAMGDLDTLFIDY